MALPSPPDPAARSRALEALEHSAAAAGAKDMDNETRAAKNNQRELDGRLAEFANSWNKLMTLAEKGIWNARQAKKTRQAFERLIRSQGWVEDKPLPDQRASR